MSDAEGFEGWRRRSQTDGTTIEDKARRCIVDDVICAAADEEQIKLDLARAESILHSMSSEIAQISHAQTQRNQVVAAEVRGYMFRRHFLLEQRGAHEVDVVRHVMTSQDMQWGAELRHVALEDMDRRDESFRDEVRRMISEIREQEAQR